MSTPTAWREYAADALRRERQSRIEGVWTTEKDVGEEYVAMARPVLEEVLANRSRPVPASVTIYGVRWTWEPA